MSQSKAFGRLPPHAASTIEPFELNIPATNIQVLEYLLKLSPLASSIYENTLPDGSHRLGVRRDWLAEAKSLWENDFDWRTTEARVNRFPNFRLPIKDECGEFDLHFTALFSEKSDAVPILLLHGWPGSFLEFLPTLQLFQDRYSAESLPYHLVVPSLPGFTLSSMPLLDRDITQIDVARIMNHLMVDLGCGEGYIAQGGDIGSRVARLLGVNHKECKAVHLNFCPMNRPASATIDSSLSQMEREGVRRGDIWQARGTAYALEHATRPSTIGFVLSSSPLALLAWIGEKFLEWTDQTPPMHTILESCSLYWFTESAHSSLWSYRHSFGPGPLITQDDPRYHIKVPFGFSYYPKEVAPTPVSWASNTGNMVWSKTHHKGGHFAALELPEEFTEDLEEFVNYVWSQDK